MAAGEAGRTGLRCRRRAGRGRRRCVRRGGGRFAQRRCRWFAGRRPQRDGLRPGLGRRSQNSAQLIDRPGRLPIQFGLRLADFGQVLVVGRRALLGQIARLLLHRLQLAASRFQIGCQVGQLARGGSGRDLSGQVFEFLLGQPQVGGHLLSGRLQLSQFPLKLGQPLGLIAGGPLGLHFAASRRPASPCVAVGGFSSAAICCAWPANSASSFDS